MRAEAANSQMATDWWSAYAWSVATGDPKGNGRAAEAGCSSDPSPKEAPASAGCQELPSEILDFLESHRLAGELLLQQHHAALCRALERAWPAGESGLAAMPAAEAPDAQASTEAGPAAEPGPQGPQPSTARVAAKHIEELHVSSLPSNASSELDEPVAPWVQRRVLIPMANSQVFKMLMQGQRATPGSLRGRLDTLTRHPGFDIFIGLLIVLNTVVIVWQLEAEAPLQEGGNFDKPSSDIVFEVLAHVFNVFFFLELLIRLYVMRCRFFLTAFNWVDALIVLLTLIDAYILTMVQGGNHQSLSFMRLTRTIRVTRALRVIRVMGLFGQLRVLLNTIAMSFMSLFWSLIILFIFMLMFSLFMCQMLMNFMLDDDNTDYRTKEWAFRHYGSSFRALYTVFEITFSGGWPNYARPLVENVHVSYALFFAVYITVVVFAMVRIVSALFLKNTLQMAASDADRVAAEKRKERRVLAAKLMRVFQMADESGDGYLSAEELHAIMERPEVSSYLGELDLETSDTELLFQVLDEGDGLVPYNRFVNGLLRLKGFSHAQETIHIMRDCEKICKHCEATRAACEELLTGLNVPRRQGGQEPSRHQRRLPSATERRTDTVLASTTSSIQMA